MMIYAAFTVYLLTVTSAQDHDLRLSDVGGKQGRVEVLNNGMWGTVCQEGWDFYDALVVCKQLGFSWLAYSGWRYDAGNGTGPVWLSNIRCDGSETRLDACVHDGWIEHQCTGYSNAAAVSCLNQTELGSAVTVYFNDAMSLFGSEGRVLLDLKTGEYKRFLISDQGWDIADADVICRQRGFHSALKATTNSYFGRHNKSLYWFQGNITYVATEFACTGTESNILECPAQSWFREDYNPIGHDAGVICNRIKEPEGFQIRLVNGTTPNEGRVEVFYNGTWGRICKVPDDHDLSFLETNVICRQLGLGYGLEAPTGDRFGRSSGPVSMSGTIHCLGAESSLAQCNFLEWMDPKNCSGKANSYDANAICSGSLAESRSPVRFPLDRIKDVGHVLIYHDGRWGTICNKGWTMANSEVVCRELGLGPPLKALVGVMGYGGPIFLEGVSCKGDEATLDQCERGEWYHHTCDHTMDVATICDNSGGEPAVSAVNTVALIVASLTALYCFM